MDAPSFLVHADLTTMLQDAVQGDDKVSAAEVRSCVKAFFTLLAEAFDSTDWIPKFHDIIHFASTSDLFKKLLRTMLLERKHKVSKEFVEPNDNTNVAWEKHVLLEVTHTSLAVLQLSDTLCFDVALLKPRKPPALVEKYLRLNLLPLI